MDRWVSAPAHAHPGWEVVAPSKLAEDFPIALPFVVSTPGTNWASMSLRNPLEQNASTFLNLLLTGEIDLAKALSPYLKAAGYTMPVAQDLAAAQVYCKTRHEGQLSKRYGMVVSSKANSRLMQRCGVDNRYAAASIRNMEIAAWYNDPPRVPNPVAAFIRRRLDLAAKLELDLPILCRGPV